MRLLILEDDPQLGDALATGLRQLGHAVDWFAEGSQADAAIDTAPYDAAVLDLGLPATDGMVWLRRKIHPDIVRTVRGVGYALGAELPS